MMRTSFDSSSSLVRHTRTILFEVLLGTALVNEYLLGLEVEFVNVKLLVIAVVVMMLICVV